MKPQKSILLLLLIFSILSCGSMEKSDRMVRRKDFFNRFSSKELVATSGWKMGEDVLVLRKNKTFRMYSKVLGAVNSGYYAGTYKIANDTLKLNYSNNHKLSFDELYFATIENNYVLKCKDTTYYIKTKN